MKHYPVRRRGQKRRLNPNQAGIDWLEGKVTGGEDFEGDTKIMLGRAFGDMAGLQILYAHGRMRKTYSRPMFQILPNVHPDDPFEREPVSPCQCDRFEVSWACEEHRELPWGENRRSWALPVGPIVRAMYEQLTWQARPVERRREVRPYVAENRPGSTVRMEISARATLYVEDESGSFSIEVEGGGGDDA